MTDEIDDLVRAAAKAHEALVPADHFDGLSSRVMARLARDDGEVAMMSETNNDAPRAVTPPPSDGKPQRSEDSGIHDMKALAETAKRRISRRITSQHDAYDESLLTSSQSGLRAVALPVQAQVVSLPAMPTDMPGAAAIAGAEAAGITPIEAARGRGTKSKAVWFVAGGGVLAAAAAAIFFITAGAQKKDDAQMAATAGAGSGSAVAQLQEAAGAPGAATGSGAVAVGSAAGSSTTVVAIDPSAPPPAEEAAKTENKTQDTASGEKAHASRGDTGGRVAGGGASSAAADKQPGGKGKEIKAGAGGGGGAGGGAAPKGPGGDSMEDLLAAASGGAQKPTEGGGDTGEAKPEKTGLDGKDIRSGMGSVAKQAQACYDQHGVAGHVKIKATVDPSGKVTKADATGEFAGTPTGSCVAAAAKSASFPEWSGAPMTISYGFTLVE